MNGQGYLVDFQFPANLTATKLKANIPSFKGLGNVCIDDVGNMYTLNIDNENIVVQYYTNIFQWNCFQKSGNRQDLDSSIVHNRVLLDLLPEDHLSRLLLFDFLGQSLFAWYGQWQQEADLEEAIEMICIALGCCPEDSPDRFRKTLKGPSHSPKLSPIDVDRDIYMDVYKLLGDLFNRRAHPEYGVHLTEYDRKLQEVMAMLWDRAVFKVVHKLNEIGISKGSRIWWCPTSVLSTFALHAAVPYDDQYGNRKYLLDNYISSYTPTLKSLISTRQGTRRDNPRLLVIGDTGLASTKKEMVAIQSRKPISKLLKDGKASRKAVIKALQETEWVHFACHGHLDPEPFNSSFKLANGSLTLLDITRTYLPNAKFAFLSACHTAEQGPIVGHDEVLHLAAAMQFYGFRSVIGTMWELLDTDGPILARDIYT
ncbi:uncharacterized protein FOMMEDRAFT_155680 [Fomitiporia mediterranea MF3/22]|uniref:uncharacterized protein n=1 Tax=Fomitiporia mediterranea (strain MF3/22) TaxID=694068 RepID=UPI0004408E12|nr:uncharacterized protein FOMMEDRAFT_155680 [Fomitiporia mediterranea MF3/22]EJD04532.1 hypothetical protein FOMMEDRAFT_155680 [Fomitiporia mediterranea MF3/22]